MEVEMQKHFSEYGTELTASAQALVEFERSHKRELAEIVDQHDRLSDKISSMENKLANERANLDGKLSNFHRELVERETKTRADLRAELGRKSLTEKGRKLEMSDDAIEEEILSALEKSARGIMQLRGRFTDCLKLERDITALRLEAASIAERPFRLRQQAALSFFRSMLQVAQIDVKFIQGGSDFGETSAATAKLKELDARLAIVAGTWDRDFHPLTFKAVSADQVLEFALQLPETAFPQVFNGWRSVRLGGGKNATLTYNKNRLTWRYRRSRVVDQPRITQIADFGRGSSSPDRPSRRARA
jgi:hypothetical protein